MTPAQRKKLLSLSDEWREEAPDWKAGAVLWRLEALGLCEIEERRVSGGDVMTGPGNTSVYRWFTRRTVGGRAALTSHDGRDK